MDPITAAVNALNTFLKFQNDIFNALPPDQKAAFATQWAQGQQAWMEFWNNVFAGKIPAALAASATAPK